MRAFLHAGRIWARDRRTAAGWSLGLVTIAALALALTVSARSFTPSPYSPARNGGNPVAFTVNSTSFPNGSDIAKKFTCDGADVSPHLTWSDPPAGTKSLALLADDPDAPVGNWNHWVLWNLPAESRQLPENMAKTAQLPDGSRQGLNDFRKTGYNGPCPPPGRPHRYYFKLLALDAKLDLKDNAGKRELETAMKGRILAQTEWMGRYGR
jgi:Raf kinase inhibitor-like YbhB/YbcL family protein